jgi:hypothetical protein
VNVAIRQSIICDEILLYVDLNPVRAGMLSDPAAYPWSSAAAHADNRDAAGLLDSWEWSEVDPGGGWQQLLRTRALDAAESASLRAATYQGRPSQPPGTASAAPLPPSLIASLASEWPLWATIPWRWLSPNRLNRWAAHPRFVPLRPGKRLRGYPTVV